MITLEEIAFLKGLGREMVETYHFAERAHEGQKRKYDGEDYIHHPLRVARRLFEWGFEHRPILIQTALLHDVLEDTAHTVSTLVDNFGVRVATRVVQLTEVKYPGMNRELRKQLYCEQIAASCEDTKLAKLADVWDNLSDFSSMVENDPGFARLYLDEKENLVINIEPTSAVFGPLIEVMNLIKHNREMYL